MDQDTQQSSRRGMLAGGNWIIDQVKMIDVYPKHENLANIHGQSQGSGGSPYNVLLDLAKMGAEFPLQGAGLVGKDALGQYILDDCRRNGIDPKFIAVNEDALTSYTDVMTEKEGGRRTFFHCRGANATWDGSDIDFSASDCRIFHLGYLLLLDAIDAEDPEYGTRGAALLATAQDAGLKTSLDVVSEDSDRFARIVGPALKHVDYCILNELEAGKTTGNVIRRKNGSLDTAALRKAAKALLSKGVKELVCVHFPEGGYVLTAEGTEYWQSSLKLPQSYIKGAAGAGDAFCSGMLMGILQDWDLQRSLLTAVCAAAQNLSDPTCTGGMKSLRTVMRLAKKYKLRPKLK